MECRIIERDKRYYPQYECQSQWRHYETCFEHEQVFDSYQGAATFIQAKMDQVIAQQQELANKHLALIKAAKRQKAKFKSLS